MLCRKCGKEIRDNVKCPYCKCENYYEYEDIPEHLKYVYGLMKRQTGNAEMDAEMGERAEAPVLDEKVKSGGGGTDNNENGNGENDSDENSNDDEEMDEMMMKKYRVMKGILTAAGCLICLFIGFTSGSYINRTLWEKENPAAETDAGDGVMVKAEDETARVNQKIEVETGSTGLEETKENASSRTVYSNNEQENAAWASPFQIETDNEGNTYMVINLPAGSEYLLYDFSEFAEIVGENSMNQNIIIRQEPFYIYESAGRRLTEKKETKVFSMKIPVEIRKIQENEEGLYER